MSKEHVAHALEGAGAGLFWVAAGLTMLAQTAPFYWVGEALSDLRWHMGFLALVPAIPAAFFLPRRRLTFLALIALGVFNLWPGLRVYVPAAEPEFEVGTPLSIVNVRWGAAPTDALEELAQSEGADVFVVSGLTPDGRASMIEHLVDWPYVQAWPPVMADSAGAPLTLTEPSTVIFSRIDLEKFQGQGFGSGACLLEASLDIGDLPVTLRVASFPELGPGEMAGARDTLLAELEARPWLPRGLFVCDLARSDASGVFGDLLSTTRYQDARRGFGRMATMAAPFWGALRIPGQYVFFGREIAISDHATRELPAGRREVVTLNVDDDTPSFYPVFTHLRVQGGDEAELTPSP